MQVTAAPNFEPAAASQPKSFPGKDDVASELVRIWQQVLGVESVGLDQNFFDLGGESSIAVQMFAQVERAFGAKLPLATLYEAPTIDELAAILRIELSNSRWSSLVPIQPSGSRPPFFCMHGAGGNVLNYRDLSKHLGPDQPFYGLQCKGLDGSCPPLMTIEEMADEYVRALQRIQPYGPYYLGGYCMGGTIAYEVAQQLSRNGETVAFLALFDTVNWYKVPLNLWTKGSHTLQQWVFHVLGFLSLDLAGKSKFLREKTTVLCNRIPVWRGMLRSRFGKQSSVGVSNDVLLANIWKTNDKACWNYIPKPYAGRVIDIRPLKQYRVFNKRDLKWDSLALGGQETIVLSAYPGNMLVEPFVGELAAALRKSMDSAMNAKESHS